MSRLARASGLVVLLAARAARGDERQAVDVRADRAEGDLELRDVELSGDVRVAVGTARLRADRLRLQRLEDGSLSIVGPARLSLCPCPDPPVELAFERVTLDERGGAVVHGGTLRLAGHDTLPIPWLALRSEHQLGLLPPSVSYRGRDGWLVGEGAHLPLGETGWLDVTPSAYLSGGHDVVGRLHTEELEARVRWDHRGEDLVAIDARADVALRRARLSADVDAIRGARGREGTTGVEEAARVYDRAAGMALLDGGPGVGLRAVAPRGAPGALVGPRVAWASGRALGSSAQTSIVVDASSLADASGEAVHVARLDAGVDGGALAGPFRLGGEGRTGALVVARPEGAAREAWGLALATLGAPLARRFGDDVHVVEPRISLPVLAVASGGDRLDPLGRPLASSSGLAAVPAFGVGSRLGSPSRPWLAAGADAGSLVTKDAPRAVGRGTLQASSDVLAAHADVALATRQAQVDGYATVVSASAGRPRGLRLSLAAEGRRGVDPVSARALSPESVTVFGGGWLQTEGWSSHAAATVPLAAWLSLSAAGYADLTARELVGERGSLVYQHACGCLRVGALVSHRLGRGGVDASIALDLAPR